MKFLKNNWPILLTAIFLIAVGILLLTNPEAFTTGIIKCGGILLIALGVFDLAKYFRADPLEGMKGSGFFAGLVMIAGGCFCLVKTDWFMHAFPVMAVIYGIFQILLGFRKLQRMVDALRLKMSGWWLLGISAAVTLLFGLWITANPETVLLGVWTFTGLSMIIEGVLDLVIAILQHRKNKDSSFANQAQQKSEA